MRSIKFMIGLIILLAATSATLAIDSSAYDQMVESENLTSLNQSTSRLYLDRSNFETNIIQHIPAPQEYTNELPPSGVKEVIYDSGKLKLKAWLSDRPADDNKHPAVVYAHGGYSFGGNEEWSTMKEFLNQGYILMAPMLRGENGNPGNFEYFYGEVNDLIEAADYLSNLSYIDNESIFLCGHSVGGQLSMLVSMMPSKYRGISSLGAYPDQESFIRYGGDPIPFDANNRREFELRSFIAYQDSIIKPLFAYMGDQEDPSTIQYCRDLFKYAKEIGMPCEFKEVKGDHFSSVGESVKLGINEFKSIQTYEALAFNRSRAYSIFNEGNDLLNQTRYEDALKRYEQSLALDPQSALAWNGKGSALVSMGKYSEAVECFEKAIEINDEFSLAWENKAYALRALGKTAEGNSALSRATQLNYMNW